MATITLHIEASDSTDLADTISSLMYLSAYKSEASTDEGREMSDEDAEVYARQDEEQAAGEPQRRRRRTKAEIAADNALAAAGGQGSSASATNASTDSAAETLGQQQSSQPSGAGAKVDPFGDQIKEVVAEDAAHVAALAAGAKVIDKGAVSDALSLAIGKIGAPAAKAILVEHGKGESIGRIDPSLYGAVHAALIAAAG